MNRGTDRIRLLVLAAGGVLVLSGCATGEAAPSATPTVTETVTASPESSPAPSPAAERSASDPTGPLDAWLACVGWAHGNYVSQFPDATVADYSEDAVVGDDGGYVVTVNIDPGGGAVGVYATCGVSGTVGNPVIENAGMGDLG